MSKNLSTPHIAEDLLRHLHAPREHVSVMAGRDSHGDVLTVFVSREWKHRIDPIPPKYQGVRVKVAQRGKIFT